MSRKCTLVLLPACSLNASQTDSCSAIYLSWYILEHFNFQLISPHKFVVITAPICRYRARKPSMHWREIIRKREASFWVRLIQKWNAEIKHYECDEIRTQTLKYSLGHFWTKLPFNLIEKKINMFFSDLNFRFIFFLYLVLSIRTD